MKKVVFLIKYIIKNKIKNMSDNKKIDEIKNLLEDGRELLIEDLKIMIDVLNNYIDEEDLDKAIELINVIKIHIKKQK